MKIRPEHLAHIREVITQFDTDFHRSRYAAAGLSDERYRWDLLRHGLKQRNPEQPSTQWICDELYPYLNDSHIDTALRHLVKPLARETECAA